MWRITGYSSVIPFAPSSARARTATFFAMRTLLNLPWLICSGTRRPSSFSLPIRVEQQPVRDRHVHFDQLLLHDLARRERPPDATRVLRVGERGLQARARRADRAPHDPVTRLAEARERRA